MQRRRAALALGLLVFASVGCGSDSKPTTPPVVTDPLPAGTALNDSPTHTMARFVATLEYQSGQSYAALLTDDFRFGFSSATDPALVAEYGDTWDARDDSSSTAHLFDGFTSETTGTFLPGATTITLSLNAVSETGDSTHVDSLDVYRVIRVARLVATIEVPADPYGGTIYFLDSAQAFYLVRGDVAVLHPGQEKRADRWYIRRWDDLAAPLFVYAPSSRGGPTTNPSRPVTWGSVKDQYRL
jgi:hypothetical protein